MVLYSNNYVRIIRHQYKQHHLFQESLSSCLRRKKDCFYGSANSPLERMSGCCCCVLFLLPLFFGSCMLAKVKMQQNKVIGCLLQKLYINIFLGVLSQLKKLMLAEVHQLSNLLLLLLLLPPPPPPPVYFQGYTLPPGNPCEGFTLPPPPADKKRTGPRPCPVCYLPVEQAIALMPEAPSFSPGVSNLTYIHEENQSKTEFGGSDFGGYPSLVQRNDSYDIRESMIVHCGGIRPGHQTGFDIDDSDLLEMESCQGVVVASAIFGAFDLIRQPKNTSEYAKKNVCFYMFVDEETEAFLRNSSELNSSMRIGLWRIVVVHNLPYDDPRRNGKVPKLLLHRLFPNARYSLWIDGKLELVVDPYQILERFLWRKSASFAISRHYKRFDVFVEAEANKIAAKFDNASIEFQVEFYKNEGLTPYTRAKLPITSDVPEGCVIIREHVPISNLFTCLWFNEVDRFTPRDQISFAIVRDKIMSKTNWTVNMFLDCERRNFVIQGYHRDILERPTPPRASIIVHPPPPVILEARQTSPIVSTSTVISTTIKKIPTKRGRERKSKRHRKVIAGNKDHNFI
ncbi:hypothetical protein RND71_012163 [Anisodus tanguticus]|uniref:TOD1/MUCI70 glycosyltransferase-like domain-containing protein n=1 Tax=Anisodus tanguticus TaxID=243964 RepID=A0AAE1SER5_9SOLA|nr:hypothetical protein RND71_012163 [Anisodus tanguticus]